MRRKIGTLLAVWIVQAIPFLILLPLTFAEDTTEYAESFFEPELWQAAGIGALFITVLQAVFLWPVRKPGRAARGRALWPSIGAAALVCAVLTVAAGFALWSVADTCLEIDIQGAVGRGAPWVVCAALAAAWIVWTPILAAFCRRGRPESALSRLAARLLLGTAVEIVAIVPLDIMVRRKSDCHSLEPSFGALVACLGVGWFAFGPALFLPLLSARRKRWYAGNCDACGYDMSGCMKAERCPECGTGWKAVESPQNT